jgi:8-oxo-dGTP pyrophosphatase MutT (NUDIX family)
MDKPIVPHEIRTIHEGRVFTLQVETLTLPSGHVMRADIIRHPGSVVIVPVTDRGEIILISQYRPALGRHMWELVAGTLKPGEEIDAAAARECQEELSLIPTTLEQLGSFYPTPGYCDEHMNFYRATGLRPPTEHDEAASPDEDEDIEAKAFPIAEVRRMIKSGEITDLKTVAGLALLNA